MVRYVSPIKFSHILILTNIAKILIVIFKKKNFNSIQLYGSLVDIIM